MNIITFIDLIFLFQRGEGGGQYRRDVSIFVHYENKTLEEGGTTSLV